MSPETVEDATRVLQKLSGFSKHEKKMYNFSESRLEVF